MLAPIVGKDLKQKFFLEVFLRVLKGLIKRVFLFFIFTPSSVQCSVHQIDIITGQQTVQAYLHLLQGGGNLVWQWWWWSYVVAPWCTMHHQSHVASPLNQPPASGLQGKHAYSRPCIKALSIRKLFLIFRILSCNIFDFNL